MRTLTRCLFTFVCLFTWLFVAMPYGKRAFAQDARAIAKRTIQSLVTIETFDDSDERLRSASGFFVRSDLVVTNFHVVEKAATLLGRIAGQSDSFQFDRIVAVDEDADLAILKVTEVVGKPLKLGDSKLVEQGQQIFALGSPAGLDGTITPGIISGIDLRFATARLGLLQISAPVSSGSSGGPVVNTRGEVIGVTKGGLTTAQNTNFAIPSSFVSALIARVENASQQQRLGTRVIGNRLTNDLGLSFSWVPPGEYSIGTTPEVLFNAALRFAQLSLVAWKRCQQQNAKKVELGKFNARSRLQSERTPLILTEICGNPFSVTPAEILDIDECNPESMKRTVNTNGFWFSRYEITWKEWMEVMRHSPKYSYNQAFLQGQKEEIYDFEPFSDACDLCPATVSFSDAVEFVRTLNAMDGNVVYGLATDTEWEIAAAGGTSTALLSAVGRFAWNMGDFPDADLSKISYKPIGTKAANGFGIFDVLGNAEEWTIFTPSEGDAPFDPTNWFGRCDLKGEQRKSFDGGIAVLRGGSIYDSEDDIRLTMRKRGGIIAGRSHPFGEGPALGAIRLIAKRKE